jgi:hypothetical protein
MVTIIKHHIHSSKRYLKVQNILHYNTGLAWQTIQDRDKAIAAVINNNYRRKSGEKYCSRRRRATVNSFYPDEYSEWRIIK